MDIGVGGCAVVPDQLSRSMRERYTVGHKHQEQRRTETLPQRVDCGHQFFRTRCELAKSKRYQTRWWLCCSARSLLPRRATNTDRFAALAPWVCVEVRLRDDVVWPEGLLQDGQQAHARRASVLVRLAAAATGLLRRALRCLSTASRYARAASSPSRSVPVTSPAPCAPPRSAGELTLRDR